MKKEEDFKQFCEKKSFYQAIRFLFEKVGIDGE